MNVSIGERWERFVEGALKTGRYGSASEVVREGRNRQVRRMTAAVGHPTLRLVRWGIGEWTVQGLGVGEWREVE